MTAAAAVKRPWTVVAWWASMTPRPALLSGSGRSRTDGLASASFRLTDLADDNPGDHDLVISRRPSDIGGAPCRDVTHLLMRERIGP